MKRVLFTPGPTEVPSEVLQAMSRPLIHHRTEEYRQYFLETTKLMQEHLGTQQPALTLSASGSGAMEAAVVNLLSAGDEAIVIEGGKFGDRWRAICQAYGVTAHTVSVEWGRVATLEEAESALAAHPQAKVMFLTHSETSTGALFPVHDMARAAKARGVVTVVDAITSYGVYDLRFDRSDLDGVVWGSQKGMMIPPGLGFICLSPRAWELAKSSKLPKFYWNLTKAKTVLEAGDTPFTPAITLVLAARAAMLLLQKEGRDQVFARHQRNADATRAAVRALGLPLFAEVPSNTLTAVAVPSGVDGSGVLRSMENRYGVKIAGGQDRLKGKIFRLGHIGYYDEGDILRLVGAFEAALLEHGGKAEPGSAVRAAQQSFRASGSGTPARVA
ncbi:MAG TPA: alanine--glyoxylate aminotransferase family protein [Candidatus Polarisedimenticolia bacterium]|nr:alanine--glyoxylate aminotransferase family protein [Candidatus Polarisedimenticolia bacterium]